MLSAIGVGYRLSIFLAHCRSLHNLDVRSQGVYGGPLPVEQRDGRQRPRVWKGEFCKSMRIAIVMGSHGLFACFAALRCVSIIPLAGATGNVANNHYHKYKDDVAMMKAIGLKYYRFSVAWPRIIPTGFLKDGVNQEGIQFYHNLLDELIHSGITPIITMYHWDLPQGLMDVNFQSANPPCDSRFKQGWYECLMDADQTPIPTGMNSTVANEFLNFAEILLKEYGSKVNLGTKVQRP